VRREVLAVALQAEHTREAVVPVAAAAVMFATVQEVSAEAAEGRTAAG